MAHIPDDHPGDDPNNWRKCPDCCGDGYSDEDGSSCMRCEGTGGIEATSGVAPTQAPSAPTRLMLEAGKGALWHASCREIEPTDDEIAAVWKAMEQARTAGVRVVGHACKLDGSICESRPDRCSDCPAGAGGKS